MVRRKRPTTGDLLSLSRIKVYEFVKAWLARPSSTHDEPQQRIITNTDGSISVLKSEAEKILSEPDTVDWIYAELLKAELKREESDYDKESDNPARYKKMDTNR